MYLQGVPTYYVQVRAPYQARSPPGISAHGSEDATSALGSPSFPLHAPSRAIGAALCVADTRPQYLKAALRRCGYSALFGADGGRAYDVPAVGPAVLTYLRHLKAIVRGLLLRPAPQNAEAGSRRLAADLGRGVTRRAGWGPLATAVVGAGRPGRSPGGARRNRPTETVRVGRIARGLH